VSLRERNPIFRRLAADHAAARWLFVSVDGAHGHAAGLGLDPGFAFGVAAPRRPDEPGALPEVRDHLGQRGQLKRVLALKLLSAREESRLKRIELGAQAFCDPGHWHGPAFA